MPSVVVCPTPILQFFLNSGAPAAGGSVLTQVSGVNAATYSDSAGTVLLPNPIPLNSRGEVSTSAGASSQLFLPANTVYTFTLFDNLGNQIWVAPFVDGIQLSLTQASVAAVLNPQTPAELAASVTPVNFQYPAGRVDRYLTNTVPGTTPMAAGFQAAINQARRGGADVTWGDTAPYVLEAPLDCTNCNGLTFRQLFNRATNLPPPGGSVEVGALWVKHFGYTVFDLAGCFNASFYDLSLVTQNAVPIVATPGLYPKTCFFLSRTTFGSGSTPHFHNTNVQGWFSVAILYNYASELGVYSDNDWQNYAPDTGACVAVITANNFFKGTQPGITSSFATIVTGNQSCLSHEFRGASFVMINASATSDLFYLEGGVDKCRLNEFWCTLSNANGTTHARAMIYNDPSAPTSGGGANRIQVHGVKLENSVTQPQYGIAIGPQGGGPANPAVNFWSVVDSFFNTSTHDIQIDTTVLTVAWRVQNVSNLSGAPGLNAPGTVQDSYFDWSVGMTIGLSQRNIFRNFLSNLTRTSHNSDVLFDHSGAILMDSSLAMNGVTAPGQFTGWGTPVGGAVINNYNITDAGGANSNTNKAVAQIITALKALGLFAA